MDEDPSNGVAAIVFIGRSILLAAIIIIAVPQVQGNPRLTLESRRRPRSPTLEEENDSSRRTRRHVSNEEGTVGGASNPASGMDWEL